MTRAWPRGAATGVGSLPGTDALAAIRSVLDDVGELPYLPELPARGAGADMIGRTAALLVDLAVELTASGWRITPRAGRDMRHARDVLERDLDALESAASGHTGALKFQAAGPWTMAAGLELANGNRVLTDHGASRDVAESLAEGLRRHAADIARRLPRATVVGQLDEPSLPAVLAGRVPTASGYGTVRHVDIAVARRSLADVLEALPGADRIVHCCAADTPVALLREAGATVLALDLDHLATAAIDAVGESIDAGVGLLLGVAPSVQGATPVTFEAVRDRLLGWWNELGFASQLLADVVVPTPACGLAGADPEYARHVMAVLAEVGRATTEQ